VTTLGATSVSLRDCERVARIEVRCTLVHHLELKVSTVIIVVLLQGTGPVVGIPFHHFCVVASPIDSCSWVSGDALTRHTFQMSWYHVVQPAARVSFAIQDFLDIGISYHHRRHLTSDHDVLVELRENEGNYFGLITETRSEQLLKSLLPCSLLDDL